MLDLLIKIEFYSLLLLCISFSGFIYTWTDGQNPSQISEIRATTQKTANTKSGKTTSVPERISPHSFRNYEKWPRLGVNGAIFEVGFEPFWSILNRLFINGAWNRVPNQGRECHFEQMTSSEQHWIIFISIWKVMWIQEKHLHCGSNPPNRWFS